MKLFLTKYRNYDKVLKVKLENAIFVGAVGKKWQNTNLRSTVQNSEKAFIFLISFFFFLQKLAK